LIIDLLFILVVQTGTKALLLSRKQIIGANKSYGRQAGV